MIHDRNLFSYKWPTGTEKKFDWKKPFPSINFGSGGWRTFGDRFFSCIFGIAAVVFPTKPRAIKCVYDNLVYPNNICSDVTPSHTQPGARDLITIYLMTCS